MTKPKCEECKRGFTILTKEKLCAFCSQRKNNEWPSEFRGSKQKRKF